MQDITRYFIILLVINLLMGTVNVIISANDITGGNAESLDNLAEEIKSNIIDQDSSTANMPENYQTQTSAGSEQEMGKGVILKLILEGLKPIPTPAGGYQTDLEEMGYIAIGNLRAFIYIMTGILGFLIFFNKKS